METTTNRIILSIYFLTPFFCIGQTYEMQDVYLNRIQMSSDDKGLYNDLFKSCDTFSKKRHYDPDYEDRIEFKIIEKCDTFFIYKDFFPKTNGIYTDYIEIIDNKDIIKIKDKELRVGMHINDIGFDNIVAQYDKYIARREEDIHREIYLGVVAMITNPVDDIRYEGNVRLIIKNYHINRMLIDFRADGDY